MAKKVVAGIEALRVDRDRFVGFAFAAADVLAELTEQGLIASATGAVRTVTGLDAVDLVGASLADLLSEADRPKVEEALASLARATRFRPVPVSIRRRDGEPQPALLGACRLPGRPPQVTITVVPHPGQRAIDPESGLVGPDAFLAEAQAAMDAANASGAALMTLVRVEGIAEGRARDPAGVAAFLSDLGAFLRMHAASDAAGRIDDGVFGVVRPADDRAGDLAAGNGSGDGAVSFRATLAALAPPSLGLSAHDVDLRAPELTPKDAARALAYTVRRFVERDGEFAIAGVREGFSALLDETIQKVRGLKASVLDGVEIAFQPIVRLIDRAVQHHEVLVRFPDGRGTQEGVDLAEGVGMAAELDLTVCRLALDRLSAGAGDLAINLSGQSLGSDLFLEALEGLLSETPGLRPYLIFELTETARLTDLGRAAKVIERLRGAGHRVCIDDYGAGVASLSYLRALPVDYLKLDGSYVEGLPRGRRDVSIIRSLSGLCRDLGVTMVAERVEREEQALCLADLGVTLGQGWLFGRPAPAPVPLTPVVAEAAPAEAAARAGGARRRR